MLYVVILFSYVAIAQSTTVHCDLQTPSVDTRILDIYGELNCKDEAHCLETFPQPIQSVRWEKNEKPHCSIQEQIGGYLDVKCSCKHLLPQSVNSILFIQLTSPLPPPSPPPPSPPPPLPPASSPPDYSTIATSSGSSAEESSGSHVWLGISIIVVFCGMISAAIYKIFHKSPTCSTGFNYNRVGDDHSTSWCNFCSC